MHRDSAILHDNHACRNQGQDSTTLEFPDAQMTLVEATTAAAKSPVTVVIFCANPLDISKLLSNDKIGAIIHVGQPSITIFGIAEVLFGMKSPAGRTIQTIYPASYADEISIFVRPPMSSKHRCARSTALKSCPPDTARSPMCDGLRIST